MTSGLAPVRRLSRTKTGAAVGAAVELPKSTAPVGPSRKVSMPIVSGAGAVMYFFSGTTTVVSVLPSLVSRTAPASRSSLLGRTKVSLSGRAWRCACPRASWRRRTRPGRSRTSAPGTPWRPARTRRGPPRHRDGLARSDGLSRGRCAEAGATTTARVSPLSGRRGTETDEWNRMINPLLINGVSGWCRGLSPALSRRRRESLYPQRLIRTRQWPKIIKWVPVCQGPKAGMPWKAPSHADGPARPG